MQNGADDVQLAIVCPDGGSVVFGPLAAGIGFVSAYDFIDGTITAVDVDGRRETLESRNGIEAMALSHFRDDLRQLSTAGHGIVFFGDHDFGSLVEMEVVRPGVVHVFANQVAADGSDLVVGELALDNLVGIVEQIERIEATFGPLVGYCGGCGIPSHGYYAKPLPN